MFRSNFRLSLLPVILASVGLAACGSLDAQTTTAPTLATIQGTLVNPNAIPITGDVRVAVIWKTAPGGKGFNIAEDLPVKASFPAAFTIQLSDPPPMSAMTLDGPPDASPAPPLAAIGVVVAYVDKNGNGKLDLVDNGAGAYVDQILATSGDTGLLYIEGNPPVYPPDSGIGGKTVAGYNVYSLCNPLPPPTPGSICQPPPCNDEVLPISTPITLSASTDPLTSDLMCASGPTSASSSGSSAPSATPGRPVTYPSPCDVNLLCADDGSSYQFDTCTTVPDGICKGTSQTCTAVVYDRPSPTPSDWPCKH
jgi:hypothetical protein